MPTGRQHLHGVHERLSKHHAAVAEHFSKLATHLGKAKDMEDPKATLQALASEHADMSAFHSACMEDCQKATDGDLNKTQPLPGGLSRVTPTNTNLRAIPRHGQPQVRLDPEIAKAFGPLTEDELNAEEPSLRGR
jgi:hypothetical protein